MQSHLRAGLVGVLVPLVFSSVLAAQNAQPPGTGKRGGQRDAAPPAPSVPHDPHDLAGIWRWSGRSVLALTNDVPPMTPAGQAKFDATRVSYGPRAVPPALGNDPMGKCDPLGMPRLLFFGAFTRMELLQSADRVVQFFEWHHVYRPIWTDGRELPKDAMDNPRWLGFSVGKWDGDVFVVDSIGFDDRTWLDHFGHPHSDEMRLQERYHRLDRDTLELTLTLNDPKIYTKPWVSDTKTFKLEPAKEMQEIFCVPSEEEAFNKRVRDPAAGVATKK